MDRTKITPGRREKCCKYYGPEGVHINLHILYQFFQVESKSEGITRIQQLLQKLSRKQDELNFNLNLCLNLNIKLIASKVIKKTR